MSSPIVPPSPTKQTIKTKFDRSRLDEVATKLDFSEPTRAPEESTCDLEILEIDTAGNCPKAPQWRNRVKNCTYIPGSRSLVFW